MSRWMPRDAEQALVAVIELSLTSWLVSGIVLGVERQPLKKLKPEPNGLLELLQRWRLEAERSGRRIIRTAVTYEVDQHLCNHQSMFAGHEWLSHECRAPPAVVWQHSGRYQRHATQLKRAEQPLVDPLPGKPVPWSEPPVLVHHQTSTGGQIAEEGFGLAQCGR